MLKGNNSLLHKTIYASQSSFANSISRTIVIRNQSTTLKYKKRVCFNLPISIRGQW